MSYNFGEKTQEWSAKHGRGLPVIQSAKFIEARKKAIEIIDSGLYGVSPSDFWILMNANKRDEMIYTGLIISHNGCLKINSMLAKEKQFKPEFLSLDKEGYGDSLVYSYCNPDQGLYEVGEVSKANCLNAYPYAMAFKRCFDRVVLKNCKLAYAGIYSDSEADEFKKPDEEAPAKEKEYKCVKCGKPFTEFEWKGRQYTAKEAYDLAFKRSGKLRKHLCFDCLNAETEKEMVLPEEL